MKRARRSHIILALACLLSTTWVVRSGFSPNSRLEERNPSSETVSSYYKRDVNKNVVIEFKDHGETTAHFTKGQLLQKFPPEELRLYEFLEDGDSPEGLTPENPRGWVTYGTIPASRLLDEAYGPRWRSAAKIRFTCVDNYKPVVPVSRFLAYSGRFVFYRKDGRATDDLFQIRNRVDGNKIVPLGPMYLTWEKMEDKEVYAEGKLSIPYQIMGLNLLDENDEKINVIASASEATKRGAAHFERLCSRCHTIRGDNGGGRGTDLTLVADRFQGSEGVLAQKLADPRIQFQGSTMTPMIFSVPDPHERELAIDDLISFLKQVAKDAHSSVSR